MAHSNRRNVLNCIMFEGPINKSAIAKRVGLSIPAVMNIVDSFMESGLVHSIGKGPSSGGKPPEMVEIMPNVNFVIGVDIGLNEIRLLLGDISGRIILELIEKLDRLFDYKVVVDVICNMVTAAQQKANVDSERILGMGVAVPGIIDTDRNVIRFAPYNQWVNVPLGDMLAKQLDFPIYVDNGTRLSALAEYYYGAGRGAQDMLFFEMGHGIGVSLINNGELYYGASGTSGEIGHVTVNRDGPRCTCGNNGCLEAMASGYAIANQAKSAIRSGIKSRMLELANGDIDAINAKITFDAAREGDPIAMSIIDRSMEYIGIGIAMAVNVLDPDLVVIGGGLTQNGDIFWDKMKRNTAMRQMRYAGNKVKLVCSQLGPRASTRGAIYLVILKHLME